MSLLPKIGYSAWVFIFKTFWSLVLKFLLTVNLESLSRHLNTELNSRFPICSVWKIKLQDALLSIIALKGNECDNFLVFCLVFAYALISLHNFSNIFMSSTQPGWLFIYSISLSSYLSWLFSIFCFHLTKTAHRFREKVFAWNMGFSVLILKMYSTYDWTIYLNIYYVLTSATL